MKKIIYIFLSLLPALTIAQDKTTIVTGTSDIARPTKIRTMYYNKFTQSRIYDSVEVVNGKFSLIVPYSGIAAQVNMIATYDNKAFTPDDSNDGKIFLVDREGAIVHIKDKISTAQVINKLEREKEVYIKHLYQVEADSAKLGQLNGAHPLIFGLGKLDSLATPEQVANYRKAQELEKLQAKFLEARHILIRKFIKENPDSYFSLEGLEELIYAGKDFEQIPQYISGLSERLRKSQDVNRIESLLSKAIRDKANPELAAAKERARNVKQLSEGMMAPDFMQLDVNGKPVKLSDFKGKYVLLDFWASWCIPCRQENPNVVKAYQQFKDKNFTVLSVALEEKTGRDKWLAAIKKDGLTWTQVADFEKAENPAAKAFGVSGIPFSFLIDPSGKIIAKELRGEALLDKLAEILSN